MKSRGVNKSKIALLIAILTALLAPLALAPRQARAEFITGGWLDVVSSFGPKNDALLASIAKSTNAQVGLTFKERVEKFARAVLKKAILDRMVNDILIWIQGGGEPQFVTDWGQFLSDAGNIAAGEFIQEIGLGRLCQPFSAQIQVALAPQRRFNNAITCTLEDVVNNVTNFYQSFENGGWIAYREALRPQNNLQGALFIAGEEQISRTQQAQFNAWSEVVSSGGWKSKKKCDPVTKTCEIVTPGDFVGNAVYSAVDAQFNAIIAAEDLADYAAAIADAIINRVIIAGVDGLKGASASSGSGAPNFDPCAGLTSAALQICREQFNSDRDTLLADIDATLGPLGQAKSSLQSSIDLETAFLTFANAYASSSKKSCVLGPNQGISPIARESVRRDRLQTELADTQSKITTLNEARAQLVNSNTITYTQLLAIQNQISPALNPALDPVGASIYRDQKQDERGFIAGELSGPLPQTTALHNSSDLPRPLYDLVNLCLNNNQL